MKTKKPALSQTPDLDKVKKSLFDAIVDDENRQLSEFEIQKYCHRVGIVFKVLINRDKKVLRIQFEQEITDLVKKYLNIIDNELFETEKD